MIQKYLNNIVTLSLVTVAFYCALQASRASASAPLGLCSETSNQNMLLLFNSDQACRLNEDLGFDWICSDSTTSITTGATASTSDKFIQSIGFRARITYAACCSSTQPLIGRVKSADSQTIEAISLSTDQGASVLLDRMVPYQKLDLLVTVATSAPNVMVIPGCRVRLVSNTVLPLTSSLAWYMQQLTSSINNEVGLRDDVQQAGELPAKWAYIKTIPATLQQQALNQLSDIDSLKSERANLTLRKNNGDTLSQEEQLRLTHLNDSNGPIEVKEANIVRLNAQRSKILEALTIAGPCDDSNQAQCLSALNSVVANIGISIDQDQTRLNDLAEFVKNEIALVDREEIQTLAELKNIADQIASRIITIFIPMNFSW